MKKSSFRDNLQIYINGGCLSPSDRFLYILFPRIVFQKNSLKIQVSYNEHEKINTDSIEPNTIKIDEYAGENKFAITLKKYLEKNLKQFLAGAYVHGSIGTGEEIPYSDFDALVILKNELLNDPRKLAVAAKLLNDARSILFSMDPLQHHGWFVMTEADLDNYPETYFPSVLFHHAKSLLPCHGLELKLKIIHQENDFNSPLDNLCNSIEKKLSLNHPGDLYSLKNLLSEFMLLPSLYVQARDKNGIFKKFSFLEAGKDFTEAEWRIMDEVSILRSKWKAVVPVWKRKFIASPRYFSFNLAKFLSPEIPHGMKEKLTTRFYADMLAFTKKINRPTK